MRKSTTKPKKLPWGKSPFDDMKHEELLFWTRRMYSACESSRSVMSNLRSSAEPGSLFWGDGGSGGRALAKTSVVVEEIERRFDRESIFLSFYRYAVDLLFAPELGYGWHLCTASGCDTMIGSSDPKAYLPKCPVHPSGKMRPIVWDDLKPAARGLPTHQGGA